MEQKNPAVQRPATHSIRRATTQDAALLAELGASTFREAFADVNRPEDMNAYVAEAFTPSEVRLALEDRRCTYWIALDAVGEALGYAKLREGPVPSVVREVPSVEIHRLYVAKHAIGTGLGSALMRTTLAHAAGCAFESVWLGVWEHNTRALDFYARWGFVKVGQHAFRLGSEEQTDFIMKRRATR